MSVVERSTTPSGAPSGTSSAASDQPGSSVDLVVVDGQYALGDGEAVELLDD